MGSLVGVLPVFLPVPGRLGGGSRDRNTPGQLVCRGPSVAGRLVMVPWRRGPGRRSGRVSVGSVRSGPVRPHVPQLGRGEVPGVEHGRPEPVLVELVGIAEAVLTGSGLPATALAARGCSGRRDDPRRSPGSSVAVGVELLGVDRLGDHHDGIGTPWAGAVVESPARKRRSGSPISGDPGMCGRMVPSRARNGPTGAPTGRWIGFRGRIYQPGP
jgi:hypothetical protein